MYENVAVLKRLIKAVFTRMLGSVNVLQLSKARIHCRSYKSSLVNYHGALS